jgi:hypothetical protein
MYLILLVRKRESSDQSKGMLFISIIAYELWEANKKANKLPHFALRNLRWRVKWQRLWQS